MDRTLAPSAVCLAALLFLICLVPFSFMPEAVVRFGGASLPISWILFFPTGGALLVSAAFTFLKERRIPVLVWTTIALTASLALSCTVAADRAIALSTVAGFKLRCLAAAWTGLLIGRDKALTNRFLSFLVVLGGLVAIAALYEPVTGHFFLFSRTIGPHQTLSELWLPAQRIAVGAVGQPLPLSAILNLLLPFSLWRWARDRRPLDLAASIFMAVAILMTYRRTAYLVMVVAAVSTIVVSRRALLRPAVIGFFLCLVGVLAVPPARRQIVQRFAPSYTGQELASGHRVRVYGVTLDILRAHPLLGIGTRQYERSSADWAHYTGAMNTQDSMYLRLAAENGLLGLAAILAFAGALLAQLWAGRRDDGWPFFVSCAAFLAILLVLDGFYWPAPSMIFFAIAGVGCGRVDTHAPSDAKPDKR